MKTTPLSLRLAPEVRAALVKAAKADERTLSSMADKALASYLRDHGFLKKER